MSETRWFAKRDGVEHGPFSAVQLRALAKDGRLRPADFVRRSDSPAWVAAGTIPGLFSASPRPSAPGAFAPPASPARATLGTPSTAFPATQPLSSPQPPAPPAPVIDAPQPIRIGPAATNEDSVSPAVMTGLLWAALGTGAVSILLEPWSFTFDDRPAHPVLLTLALILNFNALVLESVLLFCAWFALPARFRFRGMNPWLAAGLTFVPVFGLGWYFVSYGLLGDGWRRVASEQQPRDAEAASLLSWLGWACAGLLVAMWLLFYVEAIAEAFNADFMSWYSLPPFGFDDVNEPGKPPRGRAAAFYYLLKFFSVHAVCRAVLLYVLFLFFCTIIGRARAGAARLTPAAT